MYRLSFSFNRQQGFTIVEAMVAMTLGVFLIGGLIAVFGSSRQAYSLQTGMSVMQENGRTVIDMLSQDIAMAGYPQVSGINAFVTARSTDGGAGNDAIAVRYESSTDCLGNATPVYADTMQYAKNVYYVNGTNMKCSTLAEDDTVINDQIIAEGVESFQVLYGVDGNAADGVVNATKYLRADRVPDWTQVVSVRIGVLVNSVNSIIPDPDTNSYRVIDQVVKAAANDKLRRRLYVTTVTLRNKRG